MVCAPFDTTRRPKEQQQDIAEQISYEPPPTRRGDSPQRIRDVVPSSSRDEVPQLPAVDKNKIAAQMLKARMKGDKAEVARLEAQLAEISEAER